MVYRLHKMMRPMQTMVASLCLPFDTLVAVWRWPDMWDFAPSLIRDLRPGLWHGAEEKRPRLSLLSRYRTSMLLLSS